MRTIHSRRLRLVPVTPENASVLWSVLQEPDLREFQDLPELGAAQFQKVVAERPAVLEPAAAGRFEWIVYFKHFEDDRPLGWVSLRMSDRAPAAAEIGYSIVRARRGRGIASEAVGALIDEGFTSAQLECVRAYCVPENTSSLAVLRRNGFESDGIMPHGATVRGHPVDVIAHSLARKRWESRDVSLKELQT
jgi:ribosomal-protein-alanine N-acetyltransferase